jgi:hypothetical protein
MTRKNRETTFREELEIMGKYCTQDGVACLPRRRRTVYFPGFPEKPVRDFWSR